MPRKSPPTKAKKKPSTSKGASVPALERQLHGSAGRVRTEMVKRDGLILKLRERGLSLRRIGEVASLSHTQVGNIVSREG